MLSDPLEIFLVANVQDHGKTPTLTENNIIIHQFPYGYRTIIKRKRVW